MSDRWGYLLILLPVLLISMMAHELAHGYVAYRLGDPTAKQRGRLSLNPVRHLDPIGTAMFVITYLFSGFVFGWAKPIPVSPYYFKNRQRGMALVGIVGPMTNFIVAIIFLLVLNWVTPAVESRTWDILFLIFQINLVLGLFNLIPIPPLDGSRVLGAFLPRGAYERWVAFDRYGFLLVIVLIIVFQNSFFRLLEGAILGLARLLLTNYTIV
ncbi:MAG TPA: site-2 protease family protein [Thermoleophilia bacterium]|nr:site-2 protease family protein [Thermoleophilia bacterium]